MKKTILVLVVAAIIIFFFMRGSSQNRNVMPEQEQATTTEAVATTTAPVVDKTKTVIGKSVEGREITAYHFGADAGAGELLLVGGFHGGYSWNTALVAYQAMDYLKANPKVVPEGVRVTVIPVLNPDGLAKVLPAGTTGAFKAEDVNKSETTRVAGRFNANNVDLNRNFDCDWQAEGKWQTKNVDAGKAAFSEPESQAIKSYVESNKVESVIVWYSSAGGVYASNCHDGVLPQTKTLLNAFAKASSYPAHEEFNFYEITGDFTNWLAKRGTPAISVLLTDHEGTEWEKNRKGIEAAIQSLK